MVKMNKVKIHLLLVAFCLVTTAFAHPGRTDKYGCHTCRTNCEKWGLSYGQYHCHKPIRSNKKSKNTTFNIPQRSTLSTTTLDSLLIEILKNDISNLQFKIYILITKLDGLDKRLDYITSNYLTNLPPSESNLIDTRDLLKKYIADYKKFLQTKWQFILDNLSNKKLSYSFLRRLIDMEKEELNKDSKNIDELSYLVDRLEQVGIMIANFYSDLNNRSRPYYFQENYPKINACQQALNELNSLQNQISNIRRQVIEEASKAGGLVTQSQIEEIVNHRSREIYNKINQKLLEIKTSGICD